MKPRSNHRTITIALLEKAGFDYPDAVALVKEGRVLHRWHELECGDGTNAVERDDAGKCFAVNYRTGQRAPIRDRESQALRRVDKIMARYPSWSAYIQTDPRGCPIYLYRPGEMGIYAGCNINSCYSAVGIPVDF